MEKNKGGPKLFTVVMMRIARESTSIRKTYRISCSLIPICMLLMML